jgi:hypothetical protein
MAVADTIDKNLARSLELASAHLIAKVRKAIEDFYANQPTGWQTWEIWRTPQPWKERVLPNLEQYHAELEKAMRALQAGDIKPLTLWGATYVGLGKDLDFDMRWMTEQNRLAVDEAVDRLVGVAGTIHRLGYEALAKVGRI